jgi:allantoate deiminase
LVCFTDEEGVRFGLGMMGSRAVAGSLEAEEVERARDARGAALTEVMSAAGFDPARVGEAAARREGMSAYLELHVEQGRRLDRAGVALGVVTSIAGLGQWSIEIRGETNHAGTTAPEDRRDALQPAAALILEAQRTMTAADDLVATVGDVQVDEGAPNVIPGRVSCVLDVRSPSEGTLTKAAGEILAACGTAARSHRCQLRVSEKKRFAPVGMDPRVVEALVDATEAECGEPPLLTSMAGHDGMNLARAGVPCGMLFVRSIGGISHSAQELSSAQDCAAGARALGAAATRLARTT